MSLEALEARHGAFYAPTFTVKVAGLDLMRDLYLTVSGVDVDLKQRAAGRFSFRVPNAYDWEQRAFLAKENERRTDLLELFSFGSSVEIAMGYGEPSRLTTLLTGIVTEVSTSFAESATPELTVSGFDRLYALSHGQRSRNWENTRDSDVAAEVIRPTGLRADVRRTEPERPRIDQSQESDLAFLLKLAKRSGAIFHADAGRAYFGPRQNRASARLELAWGKGLLTFSPELNLAGQAERVEVRSRSALTGEELVGRAQAGDESGREGSQQSGAERVASALNSNPTLCVRGSVHSQAEADELARSVLEERAQSFVKGDCESIGLPEIVPDINIALTGMGQPFSRTYYVNAATHQITGGGYRTRFTVEDTTA